MSSDNEIDVNGLTDAEQHLDEFRQRHIKFHTTLSDSRHETRSRNPPRGRKRCRIQLGRQKPASVKRKRKMALDNGQQNTTHETYVHSLAVNVTADTDRHVSLFASSHNESMTDEYSDDNGWPIQQDQSTQTENIVHDRCTQSEHDNLDHVDTYIDRCVRNVLTEDFMRNLLQIMDNADLLPHFIALLVHLENGELPPNNIAVLLALERAKLHTNSSTTNMRYSIQTKQFFEYMYRLGGGEIIRLMSGSKHFNQVNNQESEKSKYDPATGDFNFAVPDERILSKSVLQLPKEIPPGMIYECFSFVDNSREYILAVDGKKCAQGLNEFPSGDINLLGHEQPTIDEQAENLRYDLKFIEDMSTITLDDMQHLINQCRNLGRLVHIVSIRLKHVRIAVAEQEQYRASMMSRLQRSNENPAKYAQGLSAVQSFVDRANLCIAGLLNVNIRLLTIMANLNQAEHYMCTEDTCDLTRQPNCHILQTPTDVNDSDYLDAHPEFVKQRTDEWHQLRFESRVTASTMYNAIGLGSVAQQRSHYKQYVLHTQQPRFTADQHEAMEFGTLNEVHVISTLCSTFAAACLPRCYHFFECGSKYIHGDTIDKLFLASPDGEFRCSEARDPTHNCNSLFSLPFHQRLTVEIKSIYSGTKDKTRTPVLYEPRKYHVPQILTQMKAWNTTAGIYVTSGTESISVMYAEFHDATFNALWTLCKEYYDEEQCPIPDYCSEDIPACKELIERYIDEYCTFFCEVPIKRSTFTSNDLDLIYTPPEPSFHPYKGRSGQPYTVIHRDWETCTAQLLATVDDCQQFVNDSFQLERKKATELLLFSICNSDRHTEMNVPLSIPVAYALKGRSLDSSLMRQLLRKVKLELCENGTNVICTAMDGQWYNIVFRDSNSSPLTVYELQRDIWKEFKNMSHANLIHYVNMNTIVTARDHERIKILPSNVLNKWQIRNMSIMCRLNPDDNGQLQRKWYVSCTGYSGKSDYFMSNLQLPDVRKRPYLWKGLVEQFNFYDIMTHHADHLDMHVLRTQRCTCANSPDPNILYSSEHILMHTNIGHTMMEHLLILLLSNRRHDRWETISTEQLYYNHLSSGQKISRSLIVPELNSCLEFLLKPTLYSHIPRMVLKKRDKVNCLARILGVPQYEQTFIPLTGLCSLRDISMHTLRHYVRPDFLRIACAESKYMEAHETWREHASMSRTVNLPGQTYAFTYFSYPDIIDENKRLDLCTIDPTHILTNLRVHCTSKEVFYCDPDAFMRVANADSAILNKAIITEMLDKQNCAIAQRVFSEAVQSAMEANGDFREANQVKTIRQWFQACNDRGLTVETRLEYLIQMHKYCMRFWKPEQFPAPGAYVCGMPQVTFQCLLQSVTSRIQIYKISARKTVNQRAISTLHLESQFSDVSVLSKQTNGCPLACDIPRHIGKMIQMNATKHDSSKCFTVRPTKKSNYPCMISDDHGQEIWNAMDDDTIDFKPHFFDYPDHKDRVKKYRRTTVSAVDAPERGTLPVRQYYKIDESKLPMTLRN